MMFTIYIEKNPKEDEPLKIDEPPKSPFPFFRHPGTHRTAIRSRHGGERTFTRTSELSFYFLGGQSTGATQGAHPVIQIHP
jgi:hypothetical protein